MPDPGESSRAADPSDIEGEPAFATDVFGSRIGLARRYAGWLTGPGLVRGLLGPREAGRIWTRHLLNCAVVGVLLPEAARVLDLGAGAGLPGIPLSLVRPDCSVLLLEPMLRRTDFLREVVGDLGLTNCDVVRGRAGDRPPAAGPVDVVTARAVAPLAALAAWAAPLLDIGGVLLALKGETAAAELDRDTQELHAAGFGSAEVLAMGGDTLESPTYVVRAVRVAASRAHRRAR